MSQDEVHQGQIVFDLMRVLCTDILAMVHVHQVISFPFELAVG